MTDKLKPCPFCGGEAEIQTHVEFDGNIKYLSKNVECTQCFAQTQRETCNGYYGLYFTDEQAIEVWNTRKPMDRIVEQLEKELYRGMEGLEPVKVSFNFGINTAIEIVKAGGKDE